MKRTNVLHLTRAQYNSKTYLKKSRVLVLTSQSSLSICNQLWLDWEVRFTDLRSLEQKLT
jgi:hypothetical protein